MTCLSRAKMVSALSPGAAPSFPASSSADLSKHVLSTLSLARRTRAGGAPEPMIDLQLERQRERGKKGRVIARGRKEGGGKGRTNGIAVFAPTKLSRRSARSLSPEHRMEECKILNTPSRNGTANSSSPRASEATHSIESAA